MRSISTSKKWALVVEDDKSFCAILSTSLEKLGFQVVEASLAADATLKIKNQKFDLMIIDIRLAQGSGDDLVLFVRRDRKGQNFGTPIIVVSGYLDKTLVQKIGKKVTAIMVKPFGPKEFRDRIDEIFGAKVA